MGCNSSKSAETGKQPGGSNPSKNEGTGQPTTTSASGVETVQTAETESEQPADLGKDNTADNIEQQPTD